MAQPSYQSAIGYVGESFFTLNFDVALDTANPPPLSAFSIQVNGSGRSVSSVTVDSAAKTVTVGISNYILTAGDIIEFTYTDPSNGNDTNAIQGLDGADSNSFNNSIVIAGLRPGPAAPAAPTLDSGSDSGALGDGITNANTPTVNGTSAIANAQIKLYDSATNTLLGSTKADGAGAWSITSALLADGVHTLKATQDDGSGTSSLSSGLTLSIDTQAAAPTGLGVASGSDSGTKGDGISNAGTPAITGVAEAGATVVLYEGSTKLGSATADGSGKWSITSSNLLEGSHTLTATQTDVAGNLSVASSGFTYIRDTVGPTKMALSTNQVNSAAATNGSTVATLSSTDLTTVTYGFAVGNGTIDADNGKFTISGTHLTAAQNLTVGSYHLYLSGTDAAGNASYQLFTLNVVDAPSVTSVVRAGAASATVSTTAPSVDYTVTFSEAVTGVDANDFTLTKTGSASGKVTSVTTLSNSTYTVTVDALSGDGTLRLDVNGSGTGIQNSTSNDLAGGYALGQTFTLDHTAPAATSMPSMTAGTDTGASSSDAITSNTTPVFTGTGEANATVRLYEGSTLLGSTTADGSGKWSITSSTLASGSHDLTTKQTDAAGNVSATSAARAVVIDTTAPAAATLTLSAGSDSGTKGDGITNITTPVITGSAEASARVKLYDSDGSTLLGTTTADLSGKWSITSSTLTVGTHNLTVKQTDVAGNVSSASAPLTVTVATAIPATPSAPLLSKASDTGTVGDGLTYIAAPVITGTAAANATVTLYDANNVNAVLGTATANGSGAWSITSSTLALGAHSLVVKQADVAGNTSLASTALALTIEAAPVAPVVPSNPAAGSTIDGVQVTQQTVTLPGGGSGTQTVIPVVTSGRVDGTGNATLADIPLVSGSGGTTLLLAQVPVGFGLTVSGGASQAAGSSTAQLIKSIQAVTANNSTSDQNHLTGNGTQFLASLASDTPLLVQTIVPTSDSTLGNNAVLTLTGTSTSSQHTALVIDSSKLPSSSSIVLNAVDFAAIIGSTTVSANTNGQVITGDAASQRFTIGVDSAGSVFAGGGSDSFTLSSSPDTPKALASASNTTLLHGGSGSDAVTLEGASSDYNVQVHAGYALVTAKAQPTQQTLVLNVERLTFSDSSVNLPGSDAQTVLAGLYQQMLGRQADYKGFDYWASQQDSGTSLGQIALSILGSNESRSVHGVVLNGTAANDVEALYQGLFGRHSEAGGLAYWVNAVNQGMTLEQVAQNFVTANEMAQYKVAQQAWDFLV